MFSFSQLFSRRAVFEGADPSSAGWITVHFIERGAPTVCDTNSGVVLAADAWPYPGLRLYPFR